MILKEYQQQALDWLEVFFKRCKTGKNLRQAYEDTTREALGFPLQYRELPTSPEVPYVCLRIPTGGGKTLIGGLAIERANRSLLFVPYSVTLWLVPSEPIREQTLKALRTRSNLLHQAVFSALGEVTILDIEEAVRTSPPTYNGSNVIIVATMQAFKRGDTSALNVYKENGYLMGHFEDVTDPQARGSHSFVDVLRMRHPFIIVDEAHNQGTPLAFDTLARFEPSAILELTATPDRWLQPSNVLYTVSAAALQAAEMIKLPLELVRRAEWRDALRDAIGCLNRLQEKAEAERKATGEYLRPILLLQAERRDAERETLTPERVKTAMVEDFGIPAETIAIATGALDEIAGEDILSEKCPIRFIITIDKLREGWDCPFAYVLCAFRNTNSATAAEQILGRILRMPGASRKTQPELNEAYAFVTSTNLQETVESLRDGLVKSGFERQETKELIHSFEESETGDLFSYNASITFATPELPAPETIPANLENKIEITPEAGSITLKGSWSNTQAVTLEKIFATTEGKETARQALEKLRGPSPLPRQKSPSERGEVFRVPLLSYQNGNLWEPFEDTHLLQGDWRLFDYSSELLESEFGKPDTTAQGGRLDISQAGKIQFEYLEKIENQLSFFFESHWDQTHLVTWLEKNLFDDSLVPDEKAAFLNQAVTDLITKRGFRLEELCYAKFRLRLALEEKIKNAKREAMQKIYQTLLINLDQFSTNDQYETVFEQGRYAYNYAYSGFTALPKHFFQTIGDLKDHGEEFECALFLSTQLEDVQSWIRNIERKATCFSLQTSTDRFYPDFICKLKDGRILVVEYKNTRDWDLPENEEKRILGKLWENRSNGKCLFIMPRGQDWEAIQRVIKSR